MPNGLSGLIRADPQPSFLKQILRILNAVSPYQPSLQPSGVTIVKGRYAPPSGIT